MIGEWFSTAWEAYKSNALPIIGAVIISAIIAGVVAAIFFLPAMGQFMTGRFDLGMLTGLFGIGLVVLFLVGVYLQGFLIAVYRDALKGSVDIGAALREAASKYVSLLVALIVAGIVVGIPIAIGAGIAYATGFDTVGIAALVILGLVSLYLGLRLAWTPAYVFIKELGGVDAVKQSWQDTGEDFGRVLYYLVAAIIIGIVNTIVAIIPIIGGLISALVIGPIGGLVYLKAAGA